MKLAIYDRPTYRIFPGLENVIFIGDHENGNSFHGTAVNWVAQEVCRQHGQKLNIEHYAVSNRMGIAEFFQWAIANKIDVINISWGFPYTKGGAWDIALQKALDAGIIITASAGNDGEKGVTWPARDPRVIAVGNWNTATNSIASDSSIGSDVFIATQGNWKIPFSGGHFESVYGTSFAASAIGMYAAIWKELTEGSREQFMEFIKSHAKDVMAPGKDNYTGWGLFQWPAGWIPKEDTSMKVITFDPGHGGTDPGAMGNMISEKVWNLEFVKLLKQKIEAKYDVRIILTRGNDSTVPNGTRDDIARANKSAGFLSFHLNSVADPAANGYESFIYQTTATTIRNIIHNEAMAYLKSHGIKDRGQKTANYQVLRENTTIPAVLFENLFLSNPKEAALLKDSKFVDGLAEAYVRGIAKAFGLSVKVIEKPKEPYTDIKGRWSEKLIRQAVSEGLIAGYPDGTFKPTQAATREEIVAFGLKLRADIIEKIEEAVKK